ncbi:hypothetical protein C8J57DRAFT_1228533 [Mycena rebaudengoi]|nr:hypothetical protein C8J57DRAFT_1228533 [Mycena rebaudengoi]
MAGPRVERGTFGLLIESSNPTEPNVHHLPGENITSPVERSSAEKNKCRKSPLCMHIVRSLSWKHEVKKNGAMQEEQNLVRQSEWLDPESNGGLQVTEGETEHKPDAHLFSAGIDSEKSGPPGFGFVLAKEISTECGKKKSIEYGTHPCCGYRQVLLEKPSANEWKRQKK